MQSAVTPCGFLCTRDVLKPRYGLPVLESCGSAGRGWTTPGFQPATRGPGLRVQEWRSGRQRAGLFWKNDEQGLATISMWGAERESWASESFNSCINLDSTKSLRWEMTQDSADPFGPRDCPQIAGGRGH